jgi:hypothetical protein
MASSVSHVIARRQPSDLLGGQPANIDVMGKQYPALTCGVLPSVRDRQVGHVPHRPRHLMGQLLRCFTPPSPLSSLLSLPTLTKCRRRRWALPSLSLPSGPPLLCSLLYAGGAGATVPTPSSSSVLSLARVLTLCLFPCFFLFIFFIYLLPPC